MTMLSADSFWTSSLRAVPEGERISRILAASIAAVDPATAVGHVLRRDGDILTISGRSYNLQSFRRVILLGMGKASTAMCTKLAEILGSRLDAGLVITKHASSIPHFPITILEGGHPIPDGHSLEAGQKTMELVSSLNMDDLFLCLISGGASALVTAPVDGISLADMQELTAVMLSSGARIGEINILRRRLDQVKGGRIAKMANGSTIISLILSDVVGDPIEVIASGPTAPDPTTRADALSVLTKYELENRLPNPILHFLRTSPETPKADDLIFEKVLNVIVGNNLLAAQAALVQAEKEGFHPYLLRTNLQGEARGAGFELATLLRQTKLTNNPVPNPACIVAGGETSVTLMGNGKGGRNTELALAAVSELADFPGVMLVTLATDGEDNTTDAAGAVVTGGTYRHAAGLDLHPGDFLKRNDSYTFFSNLDDLLKPGATGTNVNDLVFMFTFT